MVLKKNWNAEAQSIVVKQRMPRAKEKKQRGGARAAARNQGCFFISLLKICFVTDVTDKGQKNVFFGKPSIYILNTMFSFKKCVTKKKCKYICKSVHK